VTAPRIGSAVKTFVRICMIKPADYVPGTDMEIPAVLAKFLKRTTAD
jgi:hypothetical protein